MSNSISKQMSDGLHTSHFIIIDDSLFHLSCNSQTYNKKETLDAWLLVYALYSFASYEMTPSFYHFQYIMYIYSLTLGLIIVTKFDGCKLLFEL